MFDALRTFDGTDVTEIFAQCPDDAGLGLAVGNRLKKAAGFHLIDGDAPVVIGITGGTGSGKTSALQALEALGGTVLDCDAVYHQALREDETLRAASGTPLARYSGGRNWTGRSWGVSSFPIRRRWSGSTASFSTISPACCGGRWREGCWLCWMPSTS